MAAGAAACRHLNFELRVPATGVICRQQRLSTHSVSWDARYPTCYAETPPPKALSPTSNDLPQPGIISSTVVLLTAQGAGRHRAAVERRQHAWKPPTAGLRAQGKGSPLRLGYDCPPEFVSIVLRRGFVPGAGVCGCRAGGPHHTSGVILGLRRGRVESVLVGLLECRLWGVVVMNRAERRGGLLASSDDGRLDRQAEMRHGRHLLVPAAGLRGANSADARHPRETLTLVDASQRATSSGCCESSVRWPMAC